MGAHYGCLGNKDTKRSTATRVAKGLCAFHGMSTSCNALPPPLASMAALVRGCVVEDYKCMRPPPAAQLQPYCAWLLLVVHTPPALPPRCVPCWPLPLPLLFPPCFVRFDCAPAAVSASLCVYADGSVLVSHGGIEMGQGLATKVTGNHLASIGGQLEDNSPCVSLTRAFDNGQNLFSINPMCCACNNSPALLDMSGLTLARHASCSTPLRVHV